ncbi:MAG: hypothetical protein L0387_10945 [Acidobacteria bacterium]|nr:hypothetical protein [Acidobacteriota bacterium]MCI0622161.1 hypothetical protein [Acidobacteriota bacterium]MCI0721943.1 hypothetical protein [Acidobacteriota bacterium]
MSEKTTETRRRTQARRQSIVGTEPVAYVRNKYARLSWADALFLFGIDRDDGLALLASRLTPTPVSC